MTQPLQAKSSLCHSEKASFGRAFCIEVDGSGSAAILNYSNPAREV
jgi:hypothetical protein